MDRLTELPTPLAERNGHRQAVEDEFLEELMRLSGIDYEVLARQMAAIPFPWATHFGESSNSLPKIDLTPFLRSFAADLPTLTALGGDQTHLEAMSEVLRELMLPEVSKLGAAVSAASGLDRFQARLVEQLDAVNWADLALATQADPKREEARE